MELDSVRLKMAEQSRLRAVAENLAEQYADYESFTLFIGISLSVFGLVPFLIFLYPVWYGITAEYRTIITTKH